MDLFETILVDIVISMCPGNDINYEIRLSIPKNVQRVSHATARDEMRGKFPLSSIHAAQMKRTHRKEWRCRSEARIPMEAEVIGRFLKPLI
jgi:hypothetical protein